MHLSAGNLIIASYHNNTSKYKEVENEFWSWAMRVEDACMCKENGLFSYRSSCESCEDGSQLPDWLVLGMADWVVANGSVMIKRLCADGG